jgi:hypothetical protein
MSDVKVTAGATGLAEAASGSGGITLQRLLPV